MDFFTTLNLYFQLLPEINSTASSRTRCLCLERKEGGNVWVLSQQRRESAGRGTSFLIVDNMHLYRSPKSLLPSWLALGMAWSEPF